MVTHTPETEMLVDYASGALPEAVSLAVATHAALCPESQALIESYEALGGTMIEELEPAEMSAGAFTTVMSAIDTNGRIDPGLEADENTRNVLPSPLWRYVNGDLESLQWRRKGRSVRSAALGVDSRGYEVRLLEIEAGRPVPVHTHHGMEITLTLSGGYSDGEAHFGRGDFQLAGTETEHQPVADPEEPCLCLVVLEAPIRLTGRLGRLVDPFVRL